MNHLDFLNDALIGVKIWNENQKHAKGIQWIQSVVYHSFKTILQEMVIYVRVGLLEKIY